MTLFADFRDTILKITNALQKNQILPSDIEIPHFSVDSPREEKFGDISTNIAMVLCKMAKIKPRDLADYYIKYLTKNEAVQSVTIAGPGFMNITLKTSIWIGEIHHILEKKEAYGSSQIGGEKKVNIEYVSANPTGPLHVGHVRGAVYGDVLANLLKYVGYDVTKEYYINDAGAQIDILMQSVFLRYKQALGEDIQIPEGLYPADYLIPVGEALKTQYGHSLISMEEIERDVLLRDFSLETMMSLIRQDLDLLDIRHDVFTSEKALLEAGTVKKAIDFLQEKDLIYIGVLEPPKGKQSEAWEARPQTLFRSTDFGDDVDRALLKADHSYTYFASDIAYHQDKLKRGFHSMVNVWGADHGGYVKRIQASVAAMSDNQAALDVKLCQMVHLFKEGKPFKMSKRAGDFISLKEITEAVGKDAVRFIMLGRKNDAQLDFDFDKVTEKTKDNPVFYVQYAYARIHSVFYKAKAEIGVEAEEIDYKNCDFSCLKDPLEIQIIKKMVSYPRVVLQAAEAAEPHRIPFYLYELSSLFHSYWNKGKEVEALRFIIKEDSDKSNARLCLIRAVKYIIKSGLDICGVSAPKSM